MGQGLIRIGNYARNWFR